MSKGKTHWKQFTNRDYIGSWEFEEDEVKEFEIVSVSKKDVTGIGGKKTSEPVAQLKDSKPFVLNSINMETIEKIAGSPHVEKWVGLKIKIKVDPNVKFAGQKVGGLRVVLDVNQAVQNKKKALTPLKDGTKDMTNAVKYIRESDLGFDEVIKKLSARFQISPQLKKKLKEVHDEK